MSDKEKREPTDTPSSDELLKAFPEWTEDDQDSWLEFFSEFSKMFIGARLDPDSPEYAGGRTEYDERLETFREDLMMGAELADAAVAEMQTRFSIQTQQRTKQRRKAKAAYQTRRAERLGNRK